MLEMQTASAQAERGTAIGPLTITVTGSKEEEELSKKDST